MVLSICGITVSFVGFGYGQAGIGGKVYARDHMGDYHETGDAKVMAFDGSTLHEATFIGGGSYYMFVPPGNYLVTCSLIGYITQKYEAPVSEGGSVTLNFYLEQSPEPEPDPEDPEKKPVGGYVVRTDKMKSLFPFIIFGVLIAFMIAVVRVSFVDWFGVIARALGSQLVC